MLFKYYVIIFCRFKRMIQKTSKSYKTEAESSSEHTEIPKLEGYDLYLFIAYEETSADVSSLTIWSLFSRLFY